MLQLAYGRPSSAEDLAYIQHDSTSGDPAGKGGPGVQLVIMAGGEGSRLRPLTVDKPKPMAPVANQPLLEHILRLARRHGFQRATATVHYRSEAIQRHFGSGERWSVQLELMRETVPLGTAGGVRAAWRRGEPVIVLSGDALTDLNLSELMAFHRARRALVTMALHEVLDPTGLGVVQVAPDGRVLHFVEKPPREAAVGGLVNTGIYVLEPEVLELIPTGTAYDFGRNLFPLLVAEEVPVYGWHGRGYWCDVGTLERYLEANLAALRREVSLELSGQEVRPGVWIGAEAQVDPAAQLEPPLLIGDGAWIGPGACLHQCVVGAGAVVGADSCVERSVVLPHMLVEGGLQVQGSIVSEQGVLRPGTVQQPSAAAPA